MKKILQILFIFFATYVYAQKSDVKFERVGVEQGLSQTTVYAIFQDSRGFMWFGTRDGLQKYDGYSFKVYRNRPEDPNSLSNNTIRAIYEHDSMLWIGTERGLNKFDPKTEKFTRYIHDPEIPTSLSHDRIRAIVADTSGALWIGTSGGGLNRLKQPEKNALQNEPISFEHFKHEPTDLASLSHNSVYTIYPEQSGGIWVGTIGGGLNLFNSKDNSFIRYQHDPNKPSSLGSNSVNTVYQDLLGRLWIGTRGGGLDILTTNNSGNFGQKPSFIHFKHDPGDQTSLSNNNINVIKEDENGVLLIGTYGSGLDIAILPEDDVQNKKEENFTITFKHHKNDSADPYSLSNNLIRSIYEDISGVIWIGTSEGGLNKYERKRRKFNHYQHEVNNPFSLSAKSVGAIYEDRQGILWIGTYGGGLNKSMGNKTYDQPWKFKHYQQSPHDQNSLSSEVVLSIYEDLSGTIWLGTIDGGLNRFDQEKNRFTRYNHDPHNPSSISNDRVSSILEDVSEPHVLWIGTYGGLNRFDRKKMIFTSYRHDPNNIESISDDNINQIYEDSQGMIWIATRAGGLNKFDRKNKVFKRYLHDSKDSLSLSTNEVNVIYESLNKPEILWIGTYGGGLNKFNKNSEKFTQFRERDGLSSDVIAGILEDNRGNLWLSTTRGLSKFNPSTNTFRNYDLADGMQSNEFNAGAFFKGPRSGLLFFGGVNGFNTFHADEVIEDDPVKPQIAITDFQIFNKSVPIGKGTNRSPLQKSITETGEITLSHNESVFSFEFAALHYSFPEKNKYAYKMEGFDEGWNYIEHRRFTTFTALPAGEYWFRVKAANPDGVWNEAGTSIKIIITPPWWKTWWAYVLYILLFAGSIYAYVYFKTRSQARELAQERRITEQLRRVDRLKDEFLANTSHELRTPLNGIIGLTQSLIDGVAGKLPDRATANLSMVATSGKRLFSLVNDILDFSKLKTHSLELNRKPIDIRVLTDIVLKFSEPLMGNSKLVLKNSIPKDFPLIDGDPDRLQQVLHNLVHNAIKFSAKGEIEVTAYENNRLAFISVSDSGIGIPVEKLDSIFQSFEQVDASIERERGGTGLGLAITKQLVLLHGGKIKVKSTEGEGSVFTISIPIATQQQINEAQDLPSYSGKTVGVSRVRAVDDLVLATTKNAKSDENGGFRILIVDDEPINHQVYLNYLTTENYVVKQAFSGEEALQLINGKSPWDLILLDLMMPKMSGYEVCRRIRENFLPTELPIIMITAKDQVSDLVEGFACGANDYLAKPFSKNEFLARIKTHLNLLKINVAYGRFVPHEFLSTLGRESIVDVGLGDQVQDEMTIMFCDIRSYSALSETMSPKQTFNFLNAYLSRVGPIIRENNGFVNQYYGDGLMAVYQNKAEDAVISAIEIQKKVAEYNEERVKKRRQPIKIGIGIHTGPLMLGIIGDQQRMDTGAVADSVNIASRMEGLTKFYGAGVIISEQTLATIEDAAIYNYRFLGKVQVKGRAGAISVVEIFDGDAKQVIHLKTNSKSHFEKGLSYYYSKKFEDAAVQFKEVLNTNPNDKAAQLYRERSAQFMVDGIPENWEGIEVMEAKF